MDDFLEVKRKMDKLGPRVSIFRRFFISVLSGSALGAPIILIGFALTEDRLIESAILLVSIALAIFLGLVLFIGKRLDDIYAAEQLRELRFKVLAHKDVRLDIDQKGIHRVKLDVAGSGLLRSEVISFDLSPSERRMINSNRLGMGGNTTPPPILKTSLQS